MYNNFFRKEQITYLSENVGVAIKFPVLLVTTPTKAAAGNTTNFGN